MWGNFLIRELNAQFYNILAYAAYTGDHILTNFKLID